MSLKGETAFRKVTVPLDTLSSRSCDTRTLFLRSFRLKTLPTANREVWSSFSERPLSVKPDFVVCDGNSSKTSLLSIAVAPTCPAKWEYPQQGCGTCCCVTKGDVEFYNPHGENTVCTAETDAQYILTFKPTWTSTCHPRFFPFGASWSEVSGLSHATSFELWNRCSRNVSDGISEFSMTGEVETLQLEYEAVGDDILESFYVSVLEEGKGEKSIHFRADARHSYVSALVRQVR